ncbi:hypothetical protein AB0E69_08210 [Kribbella sp. NPDC026611]|uniref:TolB family protein n=1 Tax=Kribbella sp. NPDC026611 TaxID=3154911 RepID=UPI0033FE00D0
MEQEPEELLEVGSPRRVWRIAVGGLGLLVAGLIGFRLVSASDHQPSPPPTEAISVAPAGPTWSMGTGSCGTEVQLPIVASEPPRESTGLQVLVGGERLRVVDFDSGRATALATEVVKPGEYAAVLAGDPVTAYATTRSCDETAHYAMLRISVDRHVSLVRSLGPNESLLTDANHVWIVAFAADVEHPYATITPASGGKRVQLPLGFYPSAIVGTTVTGMMQSDPTGPPTALALVDARTGRLLGRLDDQVSPLAAGAGQVVWTASCQEGPCLLHHRAISGGPIGKKILPNPVCCGVVSPDGKKVALVVQGASAAQVAVLHFDTGLLDVVPDVELPAKSQPGLAFSPDGDWLVIALDAGSRTRLLAWRSDLPQPYETTALEGSVEDPPTLVVTSR